VWDEILTVDLIGEAYLGTPQKIGFYKILFFVLCVMMFVVFSDVIDLLLSLFAG
jgi:hypothetical protein